MFRRLFKHVTEIFEYYLAVLFVCDTAHIATCIFQVDLVCTYCSVLYDDDFC